MVRIVEISASTGQQPPIDLADIDSDDDDDESSSGGRGSDDASLGTAEEEQASTVAPHLHAISQLGGLNLGSEQLLAPASAAPAKPPPSASSSSSLAPAPAAEAKPPSSTPPPPSPPSNDWMILQRSFGEPGDDLGQFQQPWGITMLPTGALCIAERGGPRLQVVEAVAHAACTGLEGGMLDETHCRALALPPDAVDDVQDVYCDGTSLWVADMGNHCVHRLQLPGGGVLSTIHGTGSDELAYPRAIATQRRAVSATAAVGPMLPENMLFVCDSGNGRVMAYDASSFAPVRAIGKRCDPHSDSFVQGELSLPLGVCAHHGEIYVVDGHKHRVSVFTASSGAFARSIGEPGSGAGKLKSPFGALVVRGMLVVTEATRVQVFTLDGVCRLTLEIPGAINLSGLCADEEEEHVLVCDTSRGCVYDLGVNWSDEGDRFAAELNE